MSVNIITKDTFVREVAACEKTVLLDFYATWCAPCRMISPVIKEIAAENSDIKVCKIDVDKEHELAQAFGVVSIPTLVIMKNGKITGQVTGVRSKADILDLLYD